LVICQDQAYHRLLHWRMRIRAAGGNPNEERICSCCKAVKPHTAFPPARRGPCGRATSCRLCGARHDLARYYRRIQRTILILAYVQSVADGGGPY
jgi:hypothetical protein